MIGGQTTGVIRSASCSEFAECSLIRDGICGMRQ